MLPLYAKNCPPLPIEVHYDQRDPHRYFIARFASNQALSPLGVLWKLMVCAFCALIGTTLIAGNVWIALGAALITAGGAYSASQSKKARPAP